MSELKEFVSQLSKDLGFQQSLDANEDGSYSLRLEPEIGVTLKETPEALISLRARVAELPTDKLEDCLLTLMKANLFSRETGGAALGVDNEGKRVVLVQFFPVALGYRAFHEAVEDFANYVETWRHDIQGLAGSPSGEEDSEK